MFKEESDLNSQDSGVLLNQPDQGVGYQVAGALQRLGRRMLGLLPNSDHLSRLKHTPMQIFQIDWKQNPSGVAEIGSPFTSAVLSLEPHLSKGSEPLKDELEKLEILAKTLVKKEPQLRLIYVLSQSTPKSNIEKLHSIGNKTTTFVCPITFGFRDHGLLDQALNFYSQKAGLLEKSITSAKANSLPFSYVGDLSSFIVSALNQSACEKKILHVPANIVGLEQFRQNFLRFFNADAGFFERIASAVSNEKLGDFLNDRECEKTHSEEESSNNVLDYFPTLLSSPERIFSQLKRLYHQKPTTELVFPPSRSI